MIISVVFYYFVNTNISFIVLLYQINLVVTKNKDMLENEQVSFYLLFINVFTR